MLLEINKKQDWIMTRQSDEGMKNLSFWKVKQELFRTGVKPKLNTIQHFKT